MKVWWALCDTVQLRIISALVLISHRVNLCNMKEKAVLLLKTHLSITKYLIQEPGHLGYLLASASSKYVPISTHFGGYFNSTHVVACQWYQGFLGGFITHYGCCSNNMVALCLGLRKLNHWISGEIDWLPSIT